MQLEPSLKQLGMLGTGRDIIAKEGVKGLVSGAFVDCDRPHARADCLILIPSAGA